MTTPDDGPRVVFPFGEPDVRLEDFLDDKLQAPADFATLDSLLDGVRTQHAQLQAQLDDAAQALDTAHAAAAAERTALQTQVAAFEALDRSIAERLEAMTAEEAEAMAATENGAASSPAGTAAAAAAAVIPRLAAPMQQLQRVSLAHAYLELVRDANAFAVDVRAHLDAHNPRGALVPYTRLRQLAADLQQRRAAADGAATHLVAHVGTVAASVGAALNATLRADFTDLLTQRRWPTGVDAAVRADEAWRDGFAELVAWQEQDILQALQAASVSAASSRLPPPLPVLLPIDIMAELFVKEFRYHFLSSGSHRTTSDPWQIGALCFPWFLERIEAWADFLRASFADLLAVRFAETPGAHTSVYTDPACALVAALLPAMREKVDQAVAYALQQVEQLQKLEQEEQQRQQQHQQRTHLHLQPSPSQQTLQQQRPFFSALIVQLHEFDDALRTRFGYDGGSSAGPDGWPGLAAAVLDAHFPLWLQAEKTYALAQYRDIVEGVGPSSSVLEPDRGGDGGVAAGDPTTASHAIDYDYSAPGTTKPTRAAVRVMALLRAVTAQYRRVRKFGHRLRFLIDIQITLLDAYHDRLRGALETYAARTSAVGRTLHGVTREQRAALEGTGGLEALCRVYGSADHVVHTLRAWGDEEFFVLLWDELETRARAVEEPSSNVGGGLSAGHVRARTSAALGQTNGGGTDGQNDGGTGNGTSTSGGDGDGENKAAAGSLFDETIQLYQARCDAAQAFLVTALGDALRKAFRPYVSRTHWTAVAAAGEDDHRGAADVELAITPELDEPLRVLDRSIAFLGRTLSTAALRRTLRGALAQLQSLLWSDVLLAQPFTARGAARFARDMDAVEALVEQRVPHGAAALAGLRAGVRLLNLPVVAPVHPSPPDTNITLQEASDRVFTDNTAAKQVLQALGLSMLTPANARLILQRRVENSA
ncbi:rint-1/tip-1 [Niveomyces insectorum RCEF 264]|uniref:Rint-1/tip-1 n=1 Tax=Niveomyces insectorum RCEF 264 TaxID=1081102 RepID=A0A162J743_9HYPO|nr:rint-1/tip-1 [Niveomyces insectorum RCEF 264]